MRKIIIPVLIAAALFACTNKKNIIISGNYPGSGHEYFYINKVSLDNFSPVDSAKIRKSGNFSISIENDEPGFYAVGFDGNEFVTVVAEPGDRIFLQFTEGRLQNDYSIKGSDESEKIRVLDNRLGKTLLRLDSLRKEYLELTETTENNQEAEILEKEYLDIIKEQRKYNIAFILDNLSNLSAVKALYQKLNENTYVLYEPRDIQYLKLVTDSLTKYYPGASLTKSLTENLKTEMNQFYAENLTRAAEQAATVELDAYLEDLEGEKIRLSDVRKNNKYVLLSFWSAKSRECIENNMQLKEMYRLYRRNGFEIYQVNLDEDKELWKNSVRFDELPWINVREKDTSNPEVAILFNIQKVPANYLFNSEGEILGKDLFGRSLKIKLNQIFD